MANLKDMDPAEGSRKTVDKELHRQENSDKHESKRDETRSEKEERDKP